jgi:hypothetical protein
VTVIVHTDGRIEIDKVEKPLPLSKELIKMLAERIAQLIDEEQSHPA